MYVVLSGFRVLAGGAVGQQDDVFSGCWSAAATGHEHFVIKSLKPGRHVGTLHVALSQLTHRRQDVTTRRKSAQQKYRPKAERQSGT